MAIDRLAGIAQREFAMVRGKVEKVRNGVAEVSGRAYILRRDMEAGFQKIGSGMKAIIHELKGVRSEIIELHDLRAHIERLEKKVGLHN